MFGSGADVEMVGLQKRRSF